MSYKHQQPLVHPFTFFIVNCIQIVWNDVSQGPSTQVREAVRDLYWLCCCLDSKGQETLAKDMELMESFFDGKTSIDLSRFRVLLKKVMKELHEEGYFLAAKMRPPTREKSMKEFEITTALAQHEADQHA